MATLKVGGQNVYYNAPNATRAADILVANGYSKQQAAGIVGNLIAESGVDPTIKQGGGGPGRGIGQWSAGERWAQLQSWAQGHSLNPMLLDTQVQFLMYEMNTSEKGAGTAVKASNSITQAADAFMTKWERPADQSAGAQAYRADIAYQFYNVWSKVPSSEPAVTATDPLNTAGRAVTGAVDSVTGGISSINDLVKKFGDVSFWTRIVFVIVGVLLVVVAASKLSGQGTTSFVKPPVSETVKRDTEEAGATAA